MKKWIKNNKGLVIKIGVILILLIWFIILNILKNNVDFCEAYSRGFGRVLGTVLAFITSLFPISLAEVSIIAGSIVVVLIIGFAIGNLKKKEFKKAVSKMLTIFIIPAAIFSGYFTTSELQYNRKALPVPLYSGQVDKSEYYGIVKHFLDDYNYCASQLTFKEDGDIDLKDWSFQRINNELKKEFDKLNKSEIGSYFNSYTPNCKPMMSSVIYTEFQITGVDFGLYGEANINTYQPAAGYPMVFAHEIAHTKGVMREGDANMTAIYVLLNSDIPYFRYSAYYWAFDSVLSLARYTGNKEDYADLYNQIDDNIFRNDAHTYYFWKKHDMLEKISDFFNNLYIKSSGDPNGTASYNDTPVIVNPQTEIVVTYSIWQRLFLSVYYSQVNN